MNNRNLTDVNVVVINIEGAADARIALNDCESVGFSSNEDCLSHFEKYGINLENVFLFSLSEFMEEYNNDTINTDNTFIGYVSITT